MRYKVITGSVKYDGKFHQVGEVIEMPKEDAKQVIEAGYLVEEKKVKKAEKVEEPEPEELEVEEEEKEEEEEIEIEPTMDWTRKELNEFAEKIGVENPQSLPRKAAVIEVIEEKR